MTNKPLSVGNTNQSAAELIGRNVSFDFRGFLGKVSPAPSRALAKGEPDYRFWPRPEQRQER